ncbi:hypothetical protein TUN199_10249 [Pyrenophora tritici-repentis]|nr:hypothetical protein PtrV1_06510 [Pyrenophora tritici-repentis]KAI0604967.1 hypothetical protein TUN205_10787 [Pyrenophora tritici-repentis]KAI0617758.1 hypothetical protein TUN199_10249 [Pyrenophora tritici-repentis]
MLLDSSQSIHYKTINILFLTVTMTTTSLTTWMPYISRVITNANARCVVNTETKEGSSRTCLLHVWNYPTSGQPAKVVLLIGFIRQTEPLDTAADVTAQALVSDFNPPNGWNGRIIWIVVLDPFSNQWVISQCWEPVAGSDPEVKEYGRYPTAQEPFIVAALQTALSQNIDTYG